MDLKWMKQSLIPVQRGGTHLWYFDLGEIQSKGVLGRWWWERGLEVWKRGENWLIQDERRPQKYLVQHFSETGYQITQGHVRYYSDTLRKIKRQNQNCLVFVCACMCVGVREWIPTYFMPCLPINSADHWPRTPLSSSRWGNWGLKRNMVKQLTRKARNRTQVSSVCV